MSSRRRGLPSPQKLAHVVFRTTPDKYQILVNFYLEILNASIRHEDPGKIAFLSFDEEHHRIAILAVPGLTVPASDDLPRAGLDHIAFTYKTLTELAQVYVSLRDRPNDPLMPIWSINHGPTTSLYYHDPLGNKIEMQFDNFQTMEEADAYMKGNEFAENPLGVEFDPDEWSREVLAKMKPDGSEGLSVEDIRALSKRPNIGRRSEVPLGVI
ncbi:uncharacterized protein BHQ10_001986 [Talaromyces amestolkiae]|uniref:VOC domain-containing protein n=1 Tax=Talaromyces amestolkiae TaxID=1196081 RepID=A0A364KQZ6_TALAM|nr:uncharacterized protein BHQ10_001986 [Talaromyces amestolkiae]RAO65974.1 hypothetical protein BHQ10_001986 [Talaromyces amestolkiae]